MYGFNLTNPTNRPTGVQVKPLPVDLAPAGMGIDVADQDVAGEHLYRRASVILQTESGIHHCCGAQVLRRPTHARKLRTGDGEDRTAAVQLGLDLELPAHLGPVVLGHVSDDPGAEVRERCGMVPFCVGLSHTSPPGVA